VTEDLVIVGTGGHAREMLDVVEAINADRRRYNLLGFLDDAPERRGTSVRDSEVLGGVEWLAERPGSRPLVVVGIGNPAVRRRVALRVARTGARSPTLVHPSASLTRRVTVGEGSILTARVVVTTDVRLGAHVHANIGVTVSHDCVIGDFATLAPGVHLAGNVLLGEGCDIGIGAVVIPSVRIGAWVVVGAGAVAIEPVPNNAIVVGVPARVIKTRPAGWHESP
jgi:sugar O-acyltransferase (sialic acid O-acetyltransferase NeuD family)